jgi:CTP:phosphocholine cytidylyltransferase-like protein/thiamine kinase-like enzyme
MKSHHFVTICRQLSDNPALTQRELAITGKLSLGSVNSTIKECLSARLLQANGRRLILTESGQAELAKYKVKNAIILAAGFGSRCLPLTIETPKGLLKVYGQPMIERQIEQLIKQSVTDIIIVVGYKKESFDYLVDKYDKCNIRLVFNPEYALKNNLSSLYTVKNELGNSYILMSDFWIEQSIFNTYESRSWYSCVKYDEPSHEWHVEAMPSGRIKSIAIGGNGGLVTIGPAYFTEDFSAIYRKYLEQYYNSPGTGDFYWEQILVDKTDKLPIYVNEQTGNVYEFENLEELRQFDPSYNNASNSKIMQVIAQCFDISEEEIGGIEPLKKGMTNQSFIFTYKHEKYIMRIPGEGTHMIIDRARESAVYQAIAHLGISDDVVYFDPQSGYKITRYRQDAQVCDSGNRSQVAECMNKLREFHKSGVKVSHKFDIFERIEHYESLWNGAQSSFCDYPQTKAKIMQLKGYIDSLDITPVLAHIDSVPENFVFTNGEIRLIDWEYAGMADAHLDIAMFIVYSMYEREQADWLIDCYFGGNCSDWVRLKIYAYIALCGLLWSNWCEYKRQHGAEFGEYSLRQYRYAKDYYKIFMLKKVV